MVGSSSIIFPLSIRCIYDAQFFNNGRTVDNYFFTATALAIPTLLILRALNCNAIAVVLLIVMSPTYVAAIATIKADAVGGFALAAFALALLSGKYFNKTDRTLCFVCACIFLFSKFLSIPNMLVLWASALLVMWPSVIKMGFANAVTISGLNSLFSLLLKHRSVFALLIGAPTLLYAIIWIVQFDDFLRYLNVVFGPNSHWVDDRGLLDRMDQVYFSVSPGPQHVVLGPYKFQNAVLFGIPAFMISFVFIKKFRYTFALGIFGSIYFVAFALVSNVPNPGVVAPAYTIFIVMYAVFVFEISRIMSTNALSKLLVMALILVPFLYNSTSTWRAWGQPKIEIQQEYAAFEDGLFVVLADPDVSNVVFTAANARVPFLNARIRAHRDGLQRRIARISRIEQATELLASADVAVVVIPAVQGQGCDYVPSCRQASDIAALVSEDQTWLIVGPIYPIGGAAYTIYRRSGAE